MRNSFYTIQEDNRGAFFLKKSKMASGFVRWFLFGTSHVVLSNIQGPHTCR